MSSPTPASLLDALASTRPANVAYSAHTIGGYAPDSVVFQKKDLHVEMHLQWDGEYLIQFSYHFPGVESRRDGRIARLVFQRSEEPIFPSFFAYFGQHCWQHNTNSPSKVQAFGRVLLALLSDEGAGAKHALDSVDSTDRAFSRLKLNARQSR
jgi:hypothetical protein